MRVRLAGPRTIAFARRSAATSPAGDRGAICRVSALTAVVFACIAGADGQQPGLLPENPAPQRSLSLAQRATSGSAGVAGQITDSEGAVISGARIQLTVAGTTEPRSTVSDGNGRFAFSGLPAGPSSLHISLDGFVDADLQIATLDGQTLQVPPIAMRLATVTVSVDAISPVQAAAMEIREQEHQRLVGVLPNFFVSYKWTAQPLTPRQKFSLATHTVFDPGNLALSATVAGVQQATNSFPGYHQGMAGYSKRFGADLANLVIGTYMGGAVLPTVLHQDPRYFYKGTGTLRSRFFYAVSRAVICRGDNGHWQPNVSGILGDLSSGAISNLYYPASDRQGASLTLKNGFLAIAGDAMNDFAQEFVLNHFTIKGRTGKQKP